MNSGSLTGHGMMPQEELLTAIECEEWFDGEANQAMRFGGFPEWADELSERIRSQVEDNEASTRNFSPTCLQQHRHDRACLLLSATIVSPPSYYMPRAGDEGSYGIL